MATTRQSAQSRRRIGVREFRGNMTDLLRQVRQGLSLPITSRDVVIAEVRPPAKTDPVQRQAGLLRGNNIMAPDFDTLPPELMTALEDGED